MTKEYNTVTLTLFDYNNLRDFQTAIEKDHSVLINTIYRDAYKIVSKDEAVKSIAEENVLLKKEINRLNQIVNGYREVRNMSLWQFFWWWKNKKNK